MSLLLISIFFIAGIFATLFNYIDLAIVVYVLGIFFLLAIGCGFIPALLIKSLQSTYPLIIAPEWKEHNAIILPGLSTLETSASVAIKPSVMCYARIFETASLYFACKKSGHQCKIIISGGDVSTPGHPEAEIYFKELLSIGVDSTDIKLELNSRNTYQNVEFTSAILQNEKYDQVFLVTSAATLKKTLLYFSHFNIYPIPYPSDYLTALISIIPTGYNLAINDYGIHQFIGIVRYYVYNFFGWNKKPST